MKFIQSLPLLRLIVLGFFVVALPLIGAIITAIAQVDGLARESGRALFSVQKNTSASRLLVDRVTEMERTARQYQALMDKAYLDLYSEHRREAHTLLKQLREIEDNPELQLSMDKAMRSEVATNEFVVAINKGTHVNDLETAFSILREDVLTIVRQYNAVAKDLGEAMPQQANHLQRLLISQAALIIPLSVALAILFAILIARPLRQINNGIRSLGRGSLSEPVRITGARDLEALGYQLDLLRTRLIELEAQKSQFLRNVSHELKTPLTNIREGAELLLQTNNSEPDYEQLTITRILRDNSIRLQRMIEELLRFGADGDINTQQISEAVAFDQLVHDTVKKHALAVSTRAVTLTEEINPVTVMGDARRLGIIVDNLLSNAVKYTPAQGKIAIKLKQSNNSEVILDIQDSGPGIAEQDKPYLFEWFFTGPKAPETIIAGTGMGLSIAQEYAEQHGAVVSTVDSLDGAHFRLTFVSNNYAS